MELRNLGSQIRDPDCINLPISAIRVSVAEIVCSSPSSHVSIKGLARKRQRFDFLERVRAPAAGFKGSASGTGEPLENAAVTNAASTHSAPTGTR